MRIQSSPALVPLLVLSLSALSACVDEKVVFEDPGDDQPGEVPAAAAGFIGYQTYDAKLTFCGTCHTGAQAEWLATPHGKAWAAFQASGSTDAAERLRHSTNQLGNVAVEAAGYASTQDKRYEDVQCEACHGPGLTHAGGPSAANEPRAPLAVGTTLNTGCGECHKGAKSPYLEEWAQSRHMTLGGQAANPSCTACHSGDGALVAWGINSDWAERGATTGKVSITCAVCHDPHGGKNQGQLRFPVNTASLDTNLCMKCHNRRSVPDPTTQLGPHAPEGPTLLGTAGWWPAGKAKTILATHGTPEANPGLCAGCHVGSFTVGDAANPTYASKGHTFEAIPCLDASGKPVAGGDCADAERSFRSCTGAGCHGTQAVARSALAAVRARNARLIADLSTLLGKVPRSEFVNDPTITVGEGAAFNRELALMDGSAAHNPFLVEQLLIASIEEVARVYGLPLPSDLSLTPAFLPGN